MEKSNELCPLFYLYQVGKAGIRRLQRNSPFGRGLDPELDPKGSRPKPGSTLCVGKALPQANRRLSVCNLRYLQICFGSVAKIP